MKKTILLTLLCIFSSLTMRAVDHPYLTFELTDGTKASVSVSSDVAITFSGTTLTIGSESFTLTNLSKMYFSTTSETTGISEVQAISDDEIEAIYDLRGHKVSKEQMRRGVYIVKTKNGTSKVTVK